MHGDEFANGVAGADLDSADILRTKHMLGQTADDGVFADGVARTQPRAVFDHRMTGQRAAVADYNVFFDDGEGPDSHILANLSMRTDNRQRMDVHQRKSSGVRRRGGERGGASGGRVGNGPPRESLRRGCLTDLSAMLPSAIQPDMAAAIIGKAFQLRWLAAIAGRVKLFRLRRDFSWVAGVEAAEPPELNSLGAHFVRPQPPPLALFSSPCPPATNFTTRPTS